MEKEFVFKKKSSNVCFTSNTCLYCLIGNPVSHSLSPVIHNMLFNFFDYDAVYLAFNVKNIKSAIVAIRELGVMGCSVTIPHKISVIDYLDNLDKTATEIDAVNTIVNNNGILTGHNFDCDGAMTALLEKSDIKGRNVIVLGAGGAARAIGYGIKKHGGNLNIANRTEKTGKQLACDLNANFCSVADLAKVEAEVIINASSVGMRPNIDVMPVPKKVLASHMTIMDVVYDPVETTLLKIAKEMGCKTVNGLTMLAYQGSLQFESWTGFKPPLNFIRRVLTAAIV